MKKAILILMTILCLNPIFVYAITDIQSLNSDQKDTNLEDSKNQETVILEECIDVTTVKLRNSNDEIFKVKLSAIDSKLEEEILDEAKNYVCNSLISANKIVIEYDENKEDSYGRKLVWLFIDDELLQDKIVLNGYATVNDLYTSNQYVKSLLDSEAIAKKNKVGLWDDDLDLSDIDTEILEEKPKKNFFENLLDNILGAIVKIIDDILEKLLNLIEDML